MLRTDVPGCLALCGLDPQLTDGKGHLSTDFSGLWIREEAMVTAGWGSEERGWFAFFWKGIEPGLLPKFISLKGDWEAHGR